MENNHNIISFDQIMKTPKYGLVNLCTELSDEDYDIHIRSGDDAPFSKNLNCNYFVTEDFPSLSICYMGHFQNGRLQKDDEH